MKKSISAGEALLLCAKGGADMAKVKEAISGGFADSRILQVHGQRMVERDFAPRGRISVQLKDMRNALDTGKQLGFDAPITQLLEQLYAQATTTAWPGWIRRPCLPNWPSATVWHKAALLQTTRVSQAC